MTVYDAPYMFGWQGSWGDSTNSGSLGQYGFLILKDAFANAEVSACPLLFLDCTCHMCRSGIPGKLVQDAVSEVVDDFNSYSRKRKGAERGALRSHLQQQQQYDDSSSYDVSLGQRYVLQSKYLVTFRLVDTIMVFYVCEPDTNPLICLRYVDAAAKILVGISKSLTISTKRLSKKYSDLYVLLGRLLSKGVGYLPAAFIHAPSTNEKLLSLPASTHDAQRKLKKIVDRKKSKNDFVRTISEDNEQGGTVEESKEERLQKVWDASGHDVRKVQFVVPPGALPPPPNRVMGAKRTAPAAPMFVSMGERSFSGALSKSDDDLSAPDESPRDEEGEPVTSTEHTGADENAPPVILSTSQKRDLQEAIVMVEVWKGIVQDGILTSASVEGEIRRSLAPYNIDRAAFRVNSSSSLVVDACLQAALLHKSHVSKLTDPTHLFQAKLSGIPIDVSYLKYRLPSSAVNPPMQAELMIAAPCQAERTLLLCIPYAVNPEIEQGLLDVSITVSLPPDLDKLLRTSHQAVWAPSQSRIHWTFEKLAAGSHGVVRAILSQTASSGIDFETLVSHIKGTIVFSGHPGYSYSGLSFDIASSEDKGQEFVPGKIRTFGELTLVAAPTSSS